MIVVRYKDILGVIGEINVPRPKELRDGSEDCLNDYIGDYLMSRRISYKWFRIVK